MSRGRLPILAICVLLAIIGQTIADDEFELPTKHTTTAKDMESELTAALGTPDLDKYLTVVTKHKDLLRSIMILQSTSDEFQKQIKSRNEVSELFAGTGLHVLNADVARFKDDFLVDKLFTQRMQREFKEFYEESKTNYLTEVLKILTEGDYDEELD
uniref:Conserved secreted protein n=1 Tax=Panagrellus redivivus TaxID=6233 RepID=A0A7E4W214_PANRE